MSDHKAERVALDFPGAPDEAGESTIGESMWGGGSAPSLPSVDSDDRLVRLHCHQSLPEI